MAGEIKGTGSRSSAPDERRRFPRLKVRDQITAECIEGVLGVFGWGRQIRENSVLDLSQGGLRLLTSEPVPFETVLRLSIRMEPQSPEINVWGETRWCAKQKGESPAYHTGVRFFYLQPSSRQKMTQVRDGLASPRSKELIDLLARIDPDVSRPLES